jgi:hypothetical protein
MLPRLAFLAAFLALPVLAVPPGEEHPVNVAAPGGSLVPKDGDEFAKFVARAEAGDTDIDFLAMRHAWVRSDTFLRVGRSRTKLGTLQQEMYAALNGKDFDGARDSARRILEINYIDLDAQMVMKQSCKELGDEDCYKHFRYVEMGLLQSIIHGSDGKSCDTAWDVVSLDEEYFIMQVVGFEMHSQQPPGEHGMCDKMTGTEKGEPATYYFGVEKVFEGYRRKQ